MPLLTKLLNSVTGLGSATTGVVALGPFSLAGREREFRASLVALTLSRLLVGLLMITVQRPYPSSSACLTGDAETVTHSFPSGHAAAVAVFATVTRRSKRLPFLIAATLAAVVAISRVYPGTRFLSDTIVGLSIRVGAVVLAERPLDSERITLPCPLCRTKILETSFEGHRRQSRCRPRRPNCRRRRVSTPRQRTAWSAPQCRRDDRVETPLFRVEHAHISNRCSPLFPVERERSDRQPGF